MRHKTAFKEEVGSHPFRSLFDLMLGLTFVLLAALAIQNGVRKGSAKEGGGETKRKAQELLLLHNLKVRREKGEEAKLFTSLSQTKTEDPCRLLEKRGVSGLTEGERRSLETHRDALWNELGDEVQDRLLAPVVRQKYGQDRLNFPSLSDEPSDKSRVAPILDQTLSLYRQGYHKIRVEGHTDNTPILGTNSHFRTNWELSAARAIWLTKAIEGRLNNEGIKTSGATGASLEAIGYGEKRPLASNATSAGQRQNRRIEIVFERR